MPFRLLLASLLMTVPLAAQRGTLDGLDVITRSVETGKSVSLTVRGTNPCGAVEIDPGDGNVVTHPIEQLPATVTHTYRRPGNYEIRARGMGNCDGRATALVTVTGDPLPDPEARTERPVEERADTPRSRRGESWTIGRPRTVTVRAADRWTPTGVRVRDGDTIRVEASGSVVLTPGSAAVGPEGASRARFGNAPLPDRPAGALIARIGDTGSPVFVGGGDQILRADRAGELWLSVNDDYVGDNSGEFRVRVSDARAEAGTAGEPGRTARSRAAAGDVVAERDITVPAVDRWTDTRIAVRSGDVVELEASGQIRLTQNPRDTADPSGSRSRVAPDAPFPTRPAGALLVRIGSGDPIFVGARQQTVHVMENGNLWLGVNDDYVADNSGEFLVRVRVSSR